MKNERKVVKKGLNLYNLNDGINHLIIAENKKHALEIYIEVLSDERILDLEEEFDINRDEFIENSIEKINSDKPITLIEWGEGGEDLIMKADEVVNYLGTAQYIGCDEY